MIKLGACIPFMVSEQVVDYDFDARTVDTGREKEEEVTTEKIDLPAFSTFSVRCFFVFCDDGSVRLALECLYSCM